LKTAIFRPKTPPKGSVSTTAPVPGKAPLNAKLALQYYQSLLSDLTGQNNERAD
ncbi:hypothetical protein ACCO45_000119, partial [Purpureocillium lilacinum]